MLARIDPCRKLFAHRLYRHHCLFIGQSAVVKDLNILGRDIAKTIIVDNSILSFAYNLSNGVPIASFFGQSWDRELPQLHMLLEDLRFWMTKGGDVRDRLVEVF